MGRVLTIDVVAHVLAHINHNHGKGDIKYIELRTLADKRGWINRKMQYSSDSANFTILERPGGYSVRCLGKQIALPLIYDITPTVIVVYTGFSFTVEAPGLTDEHWPELKSLLEQHDFELGDFTPGEPFLVVPNAPRLDSIHDRRNLIRILTIQALGTPESDIELPADLDRNPKMREVLDASIERDIHQARKRNGYYN